MAAAVGDLDLVERHLNRDPDSLRARVSEEFFPKQDPRSGGTIYIWTIRGGRTPHQAARQFGHQEVYRFLMERIPGRCGWRGPARRETR